MTEYASDEEMYFSWWLADLQNAGLVSYIKYQPKPFKLFDGISASYLELLKTKTKEHHINVLGGHEYQADFLIFWTKELHKRLYVGYTDILNHNIKKYPIIANYSELKDQYFSVIDVKGTYSQNDAWRRFAIDQKWVFQNHNIYVQKIITHPQVNGKGKMIPANALFPNTFIPGRFIFTNKSKAKRKIKYDHIDLKSYLAKHNISSI